MVMTRNLYKIIGLFISLVLPLFLVSFKIHCSGNQVVNLLLKEGIIWLFFIALLIIARYGEKDPILFNASNINFITIAGISVLIVLSMIAVSIIYRVLYALVLRSHPPHEELLDKLLKFPVWLKLLIVLRAGIIEETFFRAYGITRIQQLTNNKFLAFIIPLLFFAACHYSYGTLNHVTGALLLGIILSVYYLKTKSLLPNIIGHAFFDVLGLFIH
jgi:membrane protease YdiL (CAAX protease family)